jgi:hypothetical protein
VRRSVPGIAALVSIYGLFEESEGGDSHHRTLLVSSDAQIWSEPPATAMASFTWA